MRLWEGRLAEAAKILIAVGDGVLADSLRFSLELEGYAVELCDEYSLLCAASSELPCCLVLDQDVFARIADRRLEAFDVPVILMTEDQNRTMIARAQAAGVTRMVEKPLLGGALFDAIKAAIDQVPIARRRNQAS
jgi:FixJ family two-component response regulator